MNVEIPAIATSVLHGDLSPTARHVRRRYEAEGFVIRPGVVPSELIDGLMDALCKDIFPSREKFYRQNPARYEANHFTKHGYLANALLDLHDYKRHRAFSQRALELFFCQPLLAEIELLTGEPRMQLMQTMLMDANPNTRPHQHLGYPEGALNGNMIAAWVALEDIDERAGRFYVMRDSRSVNLHEDMETLTHRALLARMAAWETENQNQLVAPALKKGDVLFWNSSTIHGSLPTQDARFSRKSATAHYFPEGAVFGNLFKTKDSNRVKQYRGMRYYKNQPDYHRLHAVKSAVRKHAHDSPALPRKVQGADALPPVPGVR